MKQRLLTLLVMLFASIGMTWADGDITITTADENATITLTGTFTKESLPTIAGLTPTTKTTSSVVYKLKNGSNTLAATYEEAWGDLTITLNGKVTAFNAATKGNLADHVTSLSFTGNGELETLNIEGLRAKLTTLSCDGNKLNSIPTKGSIVNYSVGTQSPAFGVITVDSYVKNNSKDGVKLSLQSFGMTVNTPFTLKDIKDITVTKAADAVNTFTFKKGAIYFEGGAITATAVVEDVDFPGVILKDVKTAPIKAPKFIFGENLKIMKEVNGQLSAATTTEGKLTNGAGQDIAENTEYDINETIDIVPVSGEGYAFVGIDDTQTKGLELLSNDNNRKFTYKVIGNADIALTAKFKAKEQKVTYSCDETKGTITITKEDNTKVANDASVPFGTKLLIRVEAKEGNTINEVKAEGATLGEANPNESNLKVYPVTMPDGNLDITATFTTPDKKITFTGSPFELSVTDKAGNSISDLNKVASGTIVNLKFTKANCLYYISALSINSETYLGKLKYEGKGVYSVTDITVNKDITINLTAAVREVIGITPDKQTSSYTGKPQTFAFELDKDYDKSKVKVEYSVSGSDYTTSAFTTVGTYNVRFSIPDDGGKYCLSKAESAKFEVIKSGGNGLIIERATPHFTAPTVTYDAKAKEKYTFTGGSVFIKDGNTNIPIAGKFIADDSKTNTAEKVYITFKMDKLEHQNNIAKVEFSLPCSKDQKTAKVNAVGTYKDNMVFKVNDVIYPSGQMIPVGSTLKIYLVNVENFTSVAVNKMQGNQVVESLTQESEYYKYIIRENDKELNFQLAVTDNSKTLVFDEATFNTGVANLIYDGNKKNISSAISFKVDGTTVTPLENVQLSFTKNGKTVKELVDAGTYQVTISRAADKDYKEFKPITKEFKIKQKALVIGTEVGKVTIDKSNLKASSIGIGHILRFSKLTGGKVTLNPLTLIPGTFEWQNKDSKTPITKADFHTVVFVPASSNYSSISLSEGVKVEVTDKPVLTFSAINGSIEVTDSKNKVYYDNTPIDTKEGVNLKFNAKPVQGYDFDHFIINMGGKEDFIYTNNYSVTVKDYSIDVKAIFKEVGSISSKRKITIQDLNKGHGLIVNTAASQEILYGKTFEFTVSCNPIDYSRLNVTVNEEPLAGINGKYTVESVKSDLTIKVSLNNPTPFTVDVQTEYKNAAGTRLGTVTVVSGLTNGKACYGDWVKLSYTEENGAKFVKWIGCSSSEFQVKENMTIKAEFMGGDKQMITLPEQGAVKGIHLEAYGKQVVEIGKSYTFTVSTYNEADLKKLIVKVNNITLLPLASKTKATSTHTATYRIDKVENNMEITIGLSAPTPIDIIIPNVVKNNKGQVMGYIGVDKKGPYYYGDKITLFATSVEGTTFSYWSDNIHQRNAVREYIVLGDDTNVHYTITAVFLGTPTGIEDIEGASITPGYGHVWVRGFANAKLTMVDMGGRVVNTQAIEGDTRIDAPAGIYVIVLQDKDNNVVREKVVIK